MAEKVQMLQQWQEVRGVLQQFEIDNIGQKIILRFPQGLSIGIPLNLIDQIKKDIGHIISILRTDHEDSTEYFLLREKQEH